MRQDYKFILKSPTGDEEIPFHGTQYQGNRALVTMSYCLVQSKYTAIELWLDGKHVKACLNRVTYRRVPNGI